MSVDTAERKTINYAVGVGIFLGVVISSIVYYALAGQPLWLRIPATGLTAGGLAAGVVLIAHYFKRK